VIALAPRILIGAAALAPLAFAHPALLRLEDFAQLPQSIVLQLAGWAALTAALWSARNKLTLNPSGLLQPAASLLAWSAASLLWAHNFYEGILPLLHWSACLAAGIAASWALKETHSLRRLATALSAAGAAAAALGVAQYAGWVSALPQVLSPAATFAHRNLAVEYIVLTLPFALAGWSGAASTRAVWGYALALALDIAFIYCAGSRTGMLMSIAAFGVFSALCFWKPGQRKLREQATRHRALSAAALLLVLFATTRITPHLQSTPGTTPERLKQTFAALKSGNLTGGTWEESRKNIARSNIRLRVIFWKNTLVMIRENLLFGVGLGNHKIHYPHYSRAKADDGISGELIQLTYAHNDFLQLTAETGAVGLGLLLWIIVAFLRAAWLALKRAAALPEQLLVVACTASGGALAIAMAGSFPLQTAFAPFLFALCAGAIAGRAVKAQTVPIDLKPAAAGAALMVCVTLFIGVARVAAEASYTRGRMQALEKNWQETITAQERAYRLLPLRKRLRFAAATAYASTGKNKQALAILEEIAAAYPYHINALYNLATTYSASGKPHRAVEVFDRILKIEPDYARAFFGLSRMFARYGEAEKAYRTMLRAAETAPQNLRYQLIAGEMAIKLKDPAQARKNLSRALKLPMPAQMQQRVTQALRALPATPPAK
jgi:tetratricopeptide (TPR) repeat protein